jgi:hypothetical protein
MLKLDEGHMYYECNTCSNDESTRFNKGVFIIMNFNLMDIYIYKTMVSHKHIKKKKDQLFIEDYLHFNFFWENSLH